MKVNKSIMARQAGAATAFAVFASALTPKVAHAEETISGADILIPKLGEFIPSLIGFLIIFAVLSKFAWPSILKAMDAREHKISDDIDAAEKTRAAADEQLAQYKAQLAHAHTDADAIISAAKQTAEQTQARIVDEAQKQAEDIVARGRQTVENERRAALVDLSDCVANLSVGAAQKIIDDQLDTDSQRKLVEKYLDEVGGFDAR